MIRFDTRNKKPKIWNVAVLSVITIILLLIMVLREQKSAYVFGFTVCVYLVITIVFLLIAFVKQLQYNPYSYNTLYYSGFSLFALASLISHIFAMINAHRYAAEYKDAYGQIYAMLFNVLGSAKNYMIFSSPFILLFSLALCVSNISLIRHEGRRLVNILGIILSFLLIGGEVFLFVSDYYVSGSQTQVMIHELLTNLFAVFYLYFECMLIGTIIANIIVVRYKHDYNKDFIIILGCGIRKDGTPTPLLKGRCDRALKFGKMQEKKTGKSPVFVTSGGQGPNEVISESACMKEYLMKNGVPEDRILTEDKSTSTYENMLYSKKVIGKITPETKIAYSTTNYHVFRSGLMARRVKMRAVGIGARTKWYFWPNAAIREFVGLLTEHRLKQGLILGGMTLLYSVLTLLLYTFT